MSGEDSEPYRHQIVEFPPITSVIIEHRLHQLACGHCGARTRSSLPPEVTRSGYGERLSAVVALLSGAYRQSHQQVKTLLLAMFSIHLSTGSINRLRQEMSKALALPVQQAHGYVQQAPVVHSDKTSFKQGNSDGGNIMGKRAWLWVLTTPWVSLFSICLSRSKAAAQTLMGEAYSGVVISDRYSGYRWIALGQRQVCWAHLKRDFAAIAERSGVSQAIGENLQSQQKPCFACGTRCATVACPGLNSAKRCPRRNSAMSWTSSPKPVEQFALASLHLCYSPRLLQRLKPQAGPNPLNGYLRYIVMNQSKMRQSL